MNKNDELVPIVLRKYLLQGIESVQNDVTIFAWLINSFSASIVNYCHSLSSLALPFLLYSILDTLADLVFFCLLPLRFYFFPFSNRISYEQCSVHAHGTQWMNLYIPHLFPRDSKSNKRRRSVSNHWER